MRDLRDDEIGMNFQLILKIYKAQIYDTVLNRTVRLFHFIRLYSWLRHILQGSDITVLNPGKSEPYCITLKEKLIIETERDVLSLCLKITIN